MKFANYSLLCLLALSPPVLAGLEYIGPSDQTIAEALEPAHRQALNINKEGPSDMVFVYGAANSPGLYRAYFRTDINIISPGTASSSTGYVYFTLYVLPANSSNALLGGRNYTIPVGGFGILQDVVGSAGISGAATIVLVVDHGRSTASSSYQYLSAWGRTYTGGSGGQFSTTLPITAGYIMTTTNWGAATGIQQDALRRTNVSAFNHMTSTTTTIRYYIFNEQGQNIGTQDVSVPPLSSVQISLSAFSVAAPGGSIRATITSSTGDATVYAVTVDNLTNDGDVRVLSWDFY